MRRVARLNSSFTMSFVTTIRPSTLPIAPGLFPRHHASVRRGGALALLYDNTHHLETSREDAVFQRRAAICERARRLGQRVTVGSQNRTQRPDVRTGVVQIHVSRCKIRQITILITERHVSIHIAGLITLPCKDGRPTEPRPRRHGIVGNASRHRSRGILA